MHDTWAFLKSHHVELLEQTYDHLYLTVIALVVAIAVALPVGLLLTRHERFAALVLGATGVVQTIPSLALLGFLIPITGIGAPPAIIALFLYALLPIVRNTYAGVRDVDPHVVEAAQGMGMSGSQVLREVELPLALPIIFAGVRTATVINVGIATLCALIGAGGLGVYIFRGISLNNGPMILAGALPAAALALALDGMLAVTQKRVHTLFKPLLALTLLILLAPVAYRLAAASDPDTSLRLGVPAEFMERSDGYEGLVARYRLEATPVEIEHGLMYQALHEGSVDAVIGYSTDGEIAALDLTVLEDDQSYFPPYFVAPIVRGSLLRRHPEIGTALAKLDGKIDAATMARLNAQVDHDKQPATAVAAGFLTSLGLSPASRRRGHRADVRIGSKIFAEQYILAEMYALLIETYTPLTVTLRTGLGGTKICFDALDHGEIDIYPEYSGTALLAILKPNRQARERVSSGSRAVYDHVKSEFSRRFDIAWLQPHGFNNTYAVIMQRQRAEAAHLSTASDLVRYSNAGREP